MPQTKEQILNSGETPSVGIFLFRNSFGPYWGDKGNGYFRIDELPWIYEAATIVNLTPEQVQQLKDDVTAVNTVIHNLPEDPTVRGQILLLLSRIVAFISNMIGI